MILPRNGKVVIFDDKYEDVQALLGALSKDSVPYHYYQDEGGEDLPTQPIKNVRLVFLDLELITGQSLPVKNIIGAIAGRLFAVIEPGTKYVLIYWSTKEDRYREVLDDAFVNGLSDYKPILTLSLNKVEALKQSDTLNFISQGIREKADDFKLFEIFTLWENLVNESAGYLINDFTDFIKSDENWDDGAKYVLYKLGTVLKNKFFNLFL